jgi:hypothetical protein
MEPLPTVMQVIVVNCDRTGRQSILNLGSLVPDRSNNHSNRINANEPELLFKKTRSTISCRLKR